MAFISSITNVDISKSTCPIVPQDTQSGSGQSGLKRRSHSRDDDATDTKKAEFYQTCIEVLKPNNEGSTSEEATFGKVVADTFARFADTERPIAKKKINDIVFELEMGLYKNYMYQSMQTPFPASMQTHLPTLAPSLMQTHHPHFCFLLLNNITFIPTCIFLVLCS